MYLTRDNIEEVLDRLDGDQGISWSIEPRKKGAIYLLRRDQDDGAVRGGLILSDDWAWINQNIEDEINGPWFQAWHDGEVDHVIFAQLLEIAEDRVSEGYY